jgi:hypothetical protein
MKRGTKILFLSLFLISFQWACENALTFNVDCSECYQQEPEDGEFSVKVSINEENPKVPIKVYVNSIENTPAIFLDTLYNGTEILDTVFSLGIKYAVEAEYKKGNKTILAVDGGKFKTKLITDVCDAECYIIVGADFDLRLK